MSKYVNHKHGLTIGSDNIFFVVDRTQPGEPPLNLPSGVGELRDGYGAILTFNGYEFTQYTSLNIGVKTPAVQLVWNFETLDWIEDYELNGVTHKLPQRRNYPIVNQWWVNWLERTVGKRYRDWDTYSRGQRTKPCLFFKKRSSALNMAKEIDRILDGIKL